jgi:predicted chitinase
MPLIYSSEKFDSSLNTYRETFSNPDNIPTSEGNEQQYDASIIIPLDFSLEMDGISGIIPNSAFEIPANILPKMYLTKKNESKIGFILHTINHNFNNNKWTTKITGQTINIRFDPLSAEEIAARKARQESLNKIQEIEKEYNKGKEGEFTPTKGCTRQAVALLSNSSVKSNISLITKAAKDFGITGQSAIAAMCAIAGGECGLIPRAEDHIYRESNLQGVFTGLTQDQVKRATARGISKKTFFSIVYGEYNPSRINNRNKADGGLYYGRGFNQLTGYGAYVKISNILVKKFGNNYNILTNPDKLNTPDVAAKALVAFYVDSMRGVDQESTKWFTKALVVTGNDANGGYDKKKEYYNCLMSDKKDLIA